MNTHLSTRLKSIAKDSLPPRCQARMLVEEMWMFCCTRPMPNSMFCKEHHPRTKDKR